MVREILGLILHFPDPLDLSRLGNTNEIHRGVSCSISKFYLEVRMRKSSCRVPRLHFTRSQYSTRCKSRCHQQESLGQPAARPDWELDWRISNQLDPPACGAAPYTHQRCAPGPRHAGPIHQRESCQVFWDQKAMFYNALWLIRDTLKIWNFSKRQYDSLPKMGGFTIF